MTASVVSPRYSADDFETGSIRSAAPSYVSDAPSYHSNPPYADPAPPYAPPPDNRNTSSSSRRSRSSQQQTIGLPPIPPAVPLGIPNLHNFRIPNWSTHNAPAARQLHSVIERRASAASAASSATSSSGSLSSTPRHNTRRYQGFLDRASQDDPDNGRQGTYHNPSQGPRQDTRQEYVRRPLEDPYLVGERAAEQAKQERIARERGDDILVREDKQWDWMLAQMRTWEERERACARYRRELEASQRKHVFSRIGARLS